MSTGFRKPTQPATAESFVEAANRPPTPPILKGVAPWANSHPKVTVPFMMRLPEELHGKLTWLKENLPNTSIQKLVRVAIEKEVDRLIEQHYQK